MGNWQTKSSKVVYETPWIKVRRDEVINHVGKPLTYSVVETHHPPVFIVATNKKGEVLLQRTYRYTIDKEIWDIPAGHSDGQDPLMAAKRELLEETGLASDDWTKLGTFYLAPGIANIPFITFIARNVCKQSDDLDKDEQILKQDFHSFAEIERKLAAGEFQNAGVIAALYAAKIHGV